MPWGCTKNVAKGLAVDRIVAELAIHHVARVVERAQGAGRQALDTHGGLVDQKGFQNRVRILRVEVVADNVNPAGLVVEVVVDAAGCVGRGVEPLLDVHQQNLVQLGHCLGGPVVALHQRFAGAHKAVFARSAASEV